MCVQLPILQERIKFKRVVDIDYAIVMERKFNYAYIFTDSADEYMEMVLHTYTPTGSNYKQTIRIMKEKLRNGRNITTTKLFSLE